VLSACAELRDELAQPGELLHLPLQPVEEEQEEVAPPKAGGKRRR
jgi:hypothetical protein